jgi:uncharacterized protein YbjT (DUF2867 family)
MKVVLYGATGMIGQAVLRECLLDPGVDTVVTVGRSATGRTDPKLRELVVPDVADTGPVTAEFADADACYFCLGVSSAGLPPERYEQITYDLTLAVGRAAADAREDLVFVYVSGAGTDSTEQGRSRWARVKGRTENALLKLPLRAYLFRPGFIQPVHGETSRTGVYRVAYRVGRPLYPVLRKLAPNAVMTSEELARAMLAVTRERPEQRVLESRDIVALGQPAADRPGDAR